MQHRLAALIGGSLASEVILGTFHGMCVTFLRKHGSKIGLRPNWVICDRDQQLQYGKSALNDPQFSEQVQINPSSPKPLWKRSRKQNPKATHPKKCFGRPKLPTKNLWLHYIDFPGTQVALLEENYRSSSSILKASLAVVQQGINTSIRFTHRNHAEI
ncbi:hypothetical protein PGT21_003170 [Puccinia graminis f. sp. tritici]|uniref:UvrD-like helicase ATP-binding domain-containing protein n=1 Tax=Puccinia graminis f. sp. tritici TaxID=56615 RepID=A0A5B0QHA7_PUCGR|nr:hypothetical protein PGT21_003170 [Puccinia graminis f. sp. tritici]